MSTPDPGEGYRLVTDYSEAPHPMAEYYCDYQCKWCSRPGPMFPYPKQFFYRVPIDPAPVPPIPLTEDPCPFFNEPGNPLTESSFTPVVVWIVVALVFATGFLLGWSFGG